MRPVESGEALAAGTRLTLLSDDKPDRLFTVLTFLIDAVSGVALDLETSYNLDLPWQPCVCAARNQLHGGANYCSAASPSTTQLVRFFTSDLSI